MIPFLASCSFPEDGQVFHDSATILCLGDGNHVQVLRISSYPNRNFQKGDDVYRVVGMNGKEEIYNEDCVKMKFQIDVDYIAHEYVSSSGSRRFTFTLAENKPYECVVCKHEIDYSKLSCTWGV